MYFHLTIKTFLHETIPWCYIFWFLKVHILRKQIWKASSVLNAQLIAKQDFFNNEMAISS